MNDNPLMTEEIREAFFLETLDLAAEVERHLLLLEQDPENMEHIRELFRPFHTIKGTAGLAEEVEILNLSQLAESVLDEVRQGRHKLSAGMLDVVLSTTDLIRSIATQHTAEPFRDEVHATLQRLEGLLQNLEQGTPEPTVGPTAILGRPEIPEVSARLCRQALIHLQALDQAVDQMKYERQFAGRLEAISAAVRCLSVLLEKNRMPEPMPSRLKYLELYVTYLDRATVPFSSAGWDLLGALRHDLLRDCYSLLVHNLNVAIHYINPGDSLDILQDSIDEASQRGARCHMVNLNLDRTPGRADIQQLIELKQRLGTQFVLVQRSLGQRRVWREISLFQDAAPKVKNTFWQGLFTLGTAA